MNIDDLTVGQARELSRLFGTETASKSHSLEIGKAYIIRTVTMIFTGRLIAVTDSDFVLEDAAWVACTARWSETLETGALDEVEPCIGPHVVGRGGFIDAAEWTHPLPREAA
jgi:hypothetical protein